MTTVTINNQKLSAELPPESVRIYIDRREQKQYDTGPMPWEWATLGTADYALAAYPDLLRIERKELSDYIACCGMERERFVREMVRLKAFPIGIVLIETTWNTLATGGWRSQVTPASALGTAVGLMADGITVICGGDRMQSEDLCKRILYMTARRRWREAREWVKALSMEGAPE